MDIPKLYVISTVLMGGEKMILSKYVNDISHRKSENFKLEKNVSENLEPLGNGYKNLGDLYIYYSACIIWNFCVNRLVSS